MQYFNQILTAILEVLDDSDSSTRELALSLIVEMLKNQVCFIYLLVHLVVHLHCVLHFELRNIMLQIAFLYYHSYSLQIAITFFSPV